MDNNRTAILLSTYNGERYIRQQLDSLLNLDISFDLYLRDDGSLDNTHLIINEYASKFTNMVYIKGVNIGVVASFFYLIEYVDCSLYDFICFCDQDDVWDKRKVSNAIGMMNNDCSPLMYCSALNVVNSDLSFKFRTTFPKYGGDFSNALVENIVTGCTIVLNNKAFELVKNSLPDPASIVMHDWWLYLVLSVKGSIVYDTNSYIKYRQHDANVEGMKKPLTRMLFKLLYKKTTKHPSLVNQLRTFKQVFSKELSATQEKILSDLIFSLENRSCYLFISLLLKRDIYRVKFIDNLSLIYSFIKRYI